MLRWRHAALIDAARTDTDTDGDGVPDAVDPSPDDPGLCGGANQDGCDDWASTCGDAPGNGGCCQTGSTPPLGAIALAGFVVLWLTGARRRRR